MKNKTENQIIYANGNEKGKIHKESGQKRTNKPNDRPTEKKSSWKSELYVDLIDEKYNMSRFRVC